MFCHVKLSKYLSYCTTWNCNEWHLEEFLRKPKAVRCMVPTSLCTSTNLANCVVPNEKDSSLMTKTFLGTLQYCTMAIIQIILHRLPLFVDYWLWDTIKHPILKQLELMKWMSYEPMDSYSLFVWNTVFEAQNPQAIISIQLPIAANLRTRLRRSLQSLAHDVIETLRADHVAIFGDEAALDVLSLFKRRKHKCHCKSSWERQVQSSFIQIPLQTSCYWERRHPISSTILVTCELATTAVTCELQDLRRALWRQVSPPWCCRSAVYSTCSSRSLALWLAG